MKMPSAIPPLKDPGYGVFFEYTGIELPNDFFRYRDRIDEDLDIYAWNDSLAEEEAEHVADRLYPLSVLTSLYEKYYEGDMDLVCIHVFNEYGSPLGDLNSVVEKLI